MRAVNRLLGLVLGLALLGAGGICAFEVVLAAVGHPFLLVPGREWTRALRTTSWDAATAVLVVACVAAAGAILFAYEAWPRRPRLVACEASEGPGRWWLLRRSVERHVRRRLLAELPAPKAGARVARRRGRWRVRVRTAASPETPGDIEDRARRALERVGAGGAVAVRVKVARPRRVA